jgi:hypothetical protein
MQTATSAVLTCAAAGVNAFAALNAVFRAFRVRYSGESGPRNPQRADGYLGLYAGLRKVGSLHGVNWCALPLGCVQCNQQPQFDVNAVGTDSIRRTHSASLRRHTTNPRVMQLALTVEFWYTNRDSGPKSVRLAAELAGAFVRVKVAFGPEVLQYASVYATCEISIFSSTMLSQPHASTLLIIRMETWDSLHLGRIAPGSIQILCNR